MREAAGAALATGVDQFVSAFTLRRSKRSRAQSRTERLDHGERIAALETLAERHRAPRFETTPDVFFGRAGEAGPWLRAPVRQLRRGGRVVDVHWESGYEPLAEEQDVLAKLSSVKENAFAHARLYLHPTPRPTAILVHGYLGGAYPVEERAWPVRWLFDQLGLDLALVVLPYHGPRRGGRRPLLPASDPRITLEGFRQAVWDIISLRRALSARGAPAVGIMGMSLGGYTTSLALTADADLAFGVPFIPLASIADFAREGGRLTGTPAEQDAQHLAIERAHAPVSPFSRRPLVAPEAIHVVAARSDRITPPSHARRLAHHFDADMTTFYGGHLLQLGRRDAFRAIAKKLASRGLLSRPPAP